MNYQTWLKTLEMENVTNLGPVTSSPSLRSAYSQQTPRPRRKVAAKPSANGFPQARKNHFRYTLRGIDDNTRPSALARTPPLPLPPPPSLSTITTYFWFQVFEVQRLLAVHGIGVKLLVKDDRSGTGAKSAA